MIRSSFSQHTKFEKCPRWWYLDKIKNLPCVQDLTYANRGDCVHKILENHYKNQYQSMDETRNDFDMLWKKYNLHNTILKNKKEESWLMILNGIQKSIPMASTEEMIYFDNALAYIDGITTNNDIIDWKTSTRSEDNKIEYKKQMIFYSWMFYRKFGKLPTSCTVHYLKYSGTKSEITIVPNTEDIKNVESWYYTISERMQDVIDSKKMPDACTLCDTFCPYKNFCHADDNEYRYTLLVDGNYVNVSGVFSSLLLTQLERKFGYELKDSFFIKKKYPNANTRVQFWDSRNRRLPLPMISELRKTLSDYCKFKNKRYSEEYIDNRIFNDEKIEMPDKLLTKELRDYQVQAVEEFLIHKTGMLQIATGGGKTLILSELIRRLNMKTLFVVDRKELMKQTKDVLERELGIEVGQIGNGVEDTKFVTVATIQTLVKNMSRYEDYLREVRFGVLDECQKVGCDSYIRLGKYLTNTEYRIGVSGTAFRDDGNDMKINSVAGYKVFDLGSEELIKKGWLMNPRVIFYHGFRSPDIDGDDYGLAYQNCISENTERNELIRTLVSKYKDKKVLILTKLVSHGDKLAKMCNGEHLHGDTGKKERNRIFNEFTKGNLNVLVSTISIFSEGLDIPELGVIINAGANSGCVKTIQMLGRVLRKNQGKNDATYIDFGDPEGFFMTASKKRIKVLENEGYDVQRTKMLINDGITTIPEDLTKTEEKQNVKN